MLPMPGTNRAAFLGLATACLMLAAVPAHAVCLGIGAAQSCSDGLGRTYTSDQETRRVIPLNKPLIASKPAEPVKLPISTASANPTGETELKAADRALNFTNMYPGFAPGGRPVTPLSR
jgi:hypothetical protein